MNHHVVPPLVLALAAGAVLPVGMSRSHWPHQAPRLALATWSALAAVFIAASSCAALLLLLPYRSSVHLSDLAEACLPWAAQACVAPHLAGVRPTDLPAIAVALALLLLPAALFLREAIRTRRLRVRHTELLNLVGRWEPALDATLFEHKTPAIYCVPGRSSQVVVSTGALRALTVVQAGRRAPARAGPHCRPSPSADRRGAVAQPLLSPDTADSPDNVRSAASGRDDRRRPGPARMFQGSTRDRPVLGGDRARPAVDDVGRRAFRRSAGTSHTDAGVRTSGTARPADVRGGHLRGHTDRPRLLFNPRLNHLLNYLVRS